VRRPAAGGLADRGCGQAQRSWHRSRRWTATVPAPRPPGHLCSTAAIRPGHKTQLRANPPLGSCGGSRHTDRHVGSRQATTLDTCADYGWPAMTAPQASWTGRLRRRSRARTSGGSPGTSGCKHSRPGCA
jgi:hypothetical protein